MFHTSTGRMKQTTVSHTGGHKIGEKYCFFSLSPQISTSLKFHKHNLNATRENICIFCLSLAMKG
jgi:hypothetical protein